MINFNNSNYNLVYGLKKNNKRWFGLQDTETKQLTILDLGLISFIAKKSIRELLPLAIEYKKKGE